MQAFWLAEGAAPVDQLVPVDQLPPAEFVHDA